MTDFQVDGDVIADVVAYLNGHKTAPAQRMADAVLRLLNRHYQDAAALEAAQEDAERLDWLDTQRGEMVVQGGYTDAPELVGHCWGVEGQCYDVRTAIDAAREARNG